MYIVTLIIALGIGFVLQMFLGYLQLKNFAKEYGRLRRIGKVAIGRKPGKIKAGTLVLLAVDNKGNILESSKMQGVTVIAKFRSLEGLNDQNIKTIKKEDLGQYNKLLRNAILDAQYTYKVVSNGGTIENMPSPLTQVMNNVENTFGKIKRRK